MSGQRDNGIPTANETTLPIEQSAASERISLNRRQLLATMGAVVVAPAVTSQPVSADDHGYGSHGYGDGPYGDPLDGGDGEPSAVPEIVRLDAEDTSNPDNPHTDVSIQWEAVIEDGELGSAVLTISDSTHVILSGTYALDGRSAERSLDMRIHNGAGETYTVELTVHSEHDTTGIEKTTFDSP